MIAGPRRRTVRARIADSQVRARPRTIAALAVTVAAIGAVVVAAVHGDHAGAPSRAVAAQPHTAGPAGVAAAYRYPLGCLSVTIAASDPAYASARLDRASPCWRYGVYVTAIFHRVKGVWRLALQASSSSCPVTSLPAAVQAQLAVCEKTATPAPLHRPRAPAVSGTLMRAAARTPRRLRTR